MSDIYRWTSGGRRVKGTDWNELLDATINLETPVEIVDKLPPATPENYGKIVLLSTDGRIYICSPP